MLRDLNETDELSAMYGTALFHFTLKMAAQYREPNPYSRRLASHSIEKLCTYIIRWMQGLPVEMPPSLASLAGKTLHLQAHVFAWIVPLPQAFSTTAAATF